MCDLELSPHRSEEHQRTVFLGSSRSGETKSFSSNSCSFSFPAWQPNPTDQSRRGETSEGSSSEKKVGKRGLGYWSGNNNNNMRGRSKSPAWKRVFAYPQKRNSRLNAHVVFLVGVFLHCFLPNTICVCDWFPKDSVSRYKYLLINFLCVWIVD